MNAFGGPRCWPLPSLLRIHWSCVSLGPPGRANGRTLESRLRAGGRRSRVRRRVLRTGWRGMRAVWWGICAGCRRSTSRRGALQEQRGAELRGLREVMRGNSVVMKREVIRAAYTYRVWWEGPLGADAFRSTVRAFTRLIVGTVKGSVRT